MLQITGDSRYADVLELVLYNAALAGVSLDGKEFFYTNTLRQLDQMPVPLRWSRKRQSYISCFCCPPNLARTIAEVQTYAYARANDAIWINLYGASVLDTQLAGGDRFVLRQETDYPWDGHVRITVQSAPSRPVALACRIPSWAKGARLTVSDSNEVMSPAPGGYAITKRVWATDDKLDLELPLRPRLIEAHPLVEEARNQVAIQRGPIVYCLESNDLAPGVTVSEIMVSGGIELQPRFEPNVLGGVTVLTGTAHAIVGRTWSNELYRELPTAELRSVPLKLIPYYAWGNRGSSEMTVWLPVRR
jgi:hypothetical protein